MPKKNEISEPNLVALDLFLARHAPELQPHTTRLLGANPIAPPGIPGTSIHNSYVVEMGKQDAQAILAALQECARAPALYEKFNGVTVHRLIGLWRGIAGSLGSQAP
jgi:H2-forming N5,N10-methylenetetrahydromethanopterin dehydrogenase-like enzyme